MAKELKISQGDMLYYLDGGRVLFADKEAVKRDGDFWRFELELCVALVQVQGPKGMQMQAVKAEQVFMGKPTYFRVPVAEVGVTDMTDDALHAQLLAARAGLVYAPAGGAK